MELTAETLEKQKYNLETLEKSEQEAKRLEEALVKERGIQDNSIQNIQPNPDGENNENTIGENAHDDEHSQGGDVSNLSEGYKSHQKRRSSSKLFSVLSHTIHGIMDVDPEATRRNSIGKTRDSIIQVRIISQMILFL